MNTREHAVTHRTPAETTEDRSAVVYASGLIKSIGEVEVLRDISISVSAGDMYGLVGPNGAGKTTTIRLLLGFGDPDAGTVRLFGSPPSNESLAKTGACFEYNTLKPSWTVEDNLLTTCNVKEIPRDRIETCLEAVHLDLSVAERPFDSLSNGMKRKASLADALLADPELLVLDEPTAGLDPQSQRAIVNVLDDLQTAGRTIILSSHDLAMIEELCDRIALVHDGATVLETPIGEAVSFVRGSCPNLDQYRVGEKTYVLDEEAIQGAELDADVSTIGLEELYHAVVRYQ